MIAFSEIVQKLPSILPREDSSVLKRFIQAFQDDVDDLGTRLEDAKTNRFIDQASGDDLERIGAAFGPLGRRAGREDDEYRAYLKSIVQVFKYRGTIPGLREAIAAGIGINSGIDEDNNEIINGDLDIYEHFNDNPSNKEEYLEYTVRIYDWPAHRGSVVENLAELADASVSRHRKTRYIIPDEQFGSSDSTSITTGFAGADSMGSDEQAFVNRNTNTITDASGSDDQITTSVGNPEELTWDQSTWDFDEWQ